MLEDVSRISLTGYFLAVSSPLKTTSQLVQNSIIHNSRENIKIAGQEKKWLAKELKYSLECQDGTDCKRCCLSRLPVDNNFKETQVSLDE